MGGTPTSCATCLAVCVMTTTQRLNAACSSRRRRLRHDPTLNCSNLWLAPRPRRRLQSHRVAERYSRSWPDANDHHYHACVPLGTITLYLWWKAGPDSTPDEIKEIGAFRLDLEKLLEGKYIRWEDEKERIVRLRFYRAPGNIIYIQTKADEPRIAVGTFP